MEINKYKRTQLAINIPAEIKAQIKSAAAIRNMKLSTWVIRALRKELRATIENPTKVCVCFKDTL